ncbi:hypothetical protein BGW38_010388, partial [Lunasporangiospora selenospora]
AELDSTFNTGGLAYKLVPGPGIRSSTFVRPKKKIRPQWQQWQQWQQGDPSLPPQPPQSHTIGPTKNHAEPASTFPQAADAHKEFRLRNVFTTFGLADKSSAGPSLQHPFTSPTLESTYSGVGSSTTNSNNHHNTISGTINGTVGSASGTVLKPPQSARTFPIFGDFLSGDDQPSTVATKFKLPGPRRKRRLTKKSHTVTAAGLLIPFSSALTDDEDSPANMSGDQKNSHGSLPHRRHQNNTFLQHLQHRNKGRSSAKGDGHRDISAVAAALGKLAGTGTDSGAASDTTTAVPAAVLGYGTNSQVTATNRSARPIPEELQKEREKFKDPNMLLVHEQKLPKKFESTFWPLYRQDSSLQYQHLRSPVHQQQFSYPQAPLLTHISPTLTMPSDMGPLPVGPLGGGHLYHPTTLSLTGSTRSVLPKLRDVLTTKIFLFKSHSNSLLQGHYVFRVYGNQLEYKKLHPDFHQLCLQYFREVAAKYQILESLDKKAQLLKREQDRKQKLASISWGSSQVYSPDRERQMGYGPKAAPNQESRGPLHHHHQHYNQHPPPPLHPHSNLNPNPPISQHSSSGEGSSIKTAKAGNFPEILKSSVAWDQPGMTPSAATTTTTTTTTTVTATPSSSVAPPLPPRPHLTHGRGQSFSYLDQRFNPSESHNALLRSMTGGNPELWKRAGNGTQKGADQSFLARGTVNAGPSSGSAGGPSSLVSLPQKLLYNRRRSWTNVQEQGRMDWFKQQAIGEADYKEAGRKYREELKQVTYGLEMFLEKLVEGVEFERYDSCANVVILNDNRDAVVFGVSRGDRTMMMQLESPCAKLKHEFLSRISFSTADQKDLESDRLLKSFEKRSRQPKIDNLFGFNNASPIQADNLDMFLEILSIRVSQQEARLQEKNGNIRSTMQQIEERVERLNNLDERAKHVMGLMLRTINSNEVQTALQPSTGTGLTLEETLRMKQDDVMKKLIICTKIMNHARYKLNKLEYQIELEQRSIRLFRQYKIIIAVVASSLIFIAWFLYHSRANAMAPQPASPLFERPDKPIERSYRFHPDERLMEAASSSPDSAIVDSEFRTSAGDDDTGKLLLVTGDLDEVGGLLKTDKKVQATDKCPRESLDWFLAKYWRCR